jgi:hypothetical protein
MAVVAFRIVRKENPQAVLDVMPGATIRKPWEKCLLFGWRIALTVGQAISIAMTVVLPAPVARIGTTVSASIIGIAAGCHAGCGWQEIVDASRLDAANLFDDEEGRRGGLIPSDNGATAQTLELCGKFSSASRKSTCIRNRVSNIAMGYLFEELIR